MVGITDTNDGKILENTSDLYNEIATNYPSSNYSEFCNQVGVRFARSEGILRQHLKDYGAAVKQVLNIWEAKGNATRAKLESALKKADTGALCTIVAKHFANDAVPEEEEESDKDAPSGTRQRRGRNKVYKEEEESDEDASSGSSLRKGCKPGTVQQRGGSQTINASGRSNVKGNTMSGSMTTVNVHNNETERPVILCAGIGVGIIIIVIFIISCAKMFP